MHPSISFTLSYDFEKIQFLDVLVYRNSMNGIETSVYTKPTDRNQILHFHSNHPPHTKNSIPISQLMRVDKIQHRRKGEKFMDRGYPGKVLQMALKKIASNVTQQTGRKNTDLANKRIPFVSEFSNSSDNIGKVLRRHWHILSKAYPQIGEFVAPPVMSYRRGKTIGGMVTSSEVKTQFKRSDAFLGRRKLGMYPCLGCVQCSREAFINPSSGEKISLRGHFTCMSKYVIYALTCPCGFIYIGETTQMVKSRISQHKSSINLGNIRLPVSKHFLEAGLVADQLKYMVLEGIPPLKFGGNRELKLKQREVWWIHRLKTLAPSGLNRDYDLYLFL
ncbi:hypothetical protein XELAEV_18018126mg [Xenopus laevis]|uniref:GIY-YIG domain-containing protein n=1 Tax=Xenopus laevis TaxID=8355 RepID=A0A974DEJ5_XENLA|nr:hypothetical protein XELAEV_18018126mg [Xenopus laevis]